MSYILAKTLFLSYRDYLFFHYSQTRYYKYNKVSFIWNYKYQVAILKFLTSSHLILWLFEQRSNSFTVDKIRISWKAKVYPIKNIKQNAIRNTYLFIFLYSFTSLVAIDPDRAKLYLLYPFDWLSWPFETLNCWSTPLKLFLLLKLPWFCGCCFLLVWRWEFVRKLEAICTDFGLSPSDSCFFLFFVVSLSWWMRNRISSLNLFSSCPLSPGNFCFLNSPRGLLSPARVRLN